MKKKIIILFIAFLVILIPCSIANNDNTINEQKNTFEINNDKKKWLTERLAIFLTLN